MEEFKRITMDNLDKEHICCCISDKKGENCVASKKEWLRDRLQAVSYTHLDVYKRQTFDFAYVP